MRVHTISQTLLGTTVLGVSVAIASSTSVSVGDGQIDGRSIEPHEFTWRQCSRDRAGRLPPERHARSMNGVETTATVVSRVRSAIVPETARLSVSRDRRPR